MQDIFLVPFFYKLLSKIAQILLGSSGSIDFFFFRFLFLFTKKEFDGSWMCLFHVLNLFLFSSKLRTEQKKIIIFIILLNKLRASRCHNHVLIQLNSFFCVFSVNEIDKNWPKHLWFLDYVVCQLFRSFFFVNQKKIDVRTKTGCSCLALSFEDIIVIWLN